MKRLFLIVMATAMWSGVTWAQEAYPGAEYISGRSSITKKVRGTLLLSATQLRFASDKGETLIVVPFETIKEVSNSVETDPGSTGAKIMLGVFASKKEEFLYVNTETADAAEALVFKCKNKTSPGILAKVRFQMKKINEAAAAKAAKESAAPPAPPESTAPSDTSQTR